MTQGLKRTDSEGEGRVETAKGAEAVSQATSTLSLRKGTRACELPDSSLQNWERTKLYCMKLIGVWLSCRTAPGNQQTLHHTGSVPRLAIG